MSPELRAQLEAAIRRAVGAAFRCESVSAVSGGCIHRAVVLRGAEGAQYFAKLNDAREAANLAAEAEGLAALAAAGMRVPAPIAHGTGAGSAFLVLEFLDLSRGASHDFRSLGRALAAMHAATGPAFGWPSDNFIGATPQRNRYAASWSVFWQRERLGPQLELAAARGYRGRLQALGARVLEAVPRLLAGHALRPALLHGDLWGGNAGFLASGEPVVFDPAVYHGDPEADLAMTELFGGFPPAFYEGYEEAAPLAPGYGVRRQLYNLYHVLNHANLFGGGYVGQAERIMAALVAEAG